MKTKYLTFIFLSFALLFSASDIAAQTPPPSESTPSLLSIRRLSIGGYGEAVYQYNFFSDNPFRYSNADRYKDSKGHGRVDMPHAVINLGYDFGHGWSFGTEIEFEHGGTEAAVEMEAEESGEYEKEIERGGEVALEQFWLQKSFGAAVNLRAGHIIVPVGGTNAAHEPDKFFGVFRPEGENTILPCTWHETGLELFGRMGDWRYDVMLLPSLNSSYFTESGWANGASASPYEFRVANRLAGAARIDNYSVPGLRLSLSGFVGNTFFNDIVTNESSKKYGSVKGLVYIGAFDFSYRHGGLVVRGNADYGHLDEADIISTYNKNLSHATGSPFPRSLVGEAAYALGIEAGYDIFSLFDGTMGGRRLFLFGRYDRYNSYLPAGVRSTIGWTERQCVSAGINYRPIPAIIVKAEGGVRLMDSQYNKEPWMALGITWVGMFN
ncbi:MAG: hypothetical protein IJ620_02885 [Bacteroidales bacterium]|nr:hypothetical protein [Bacteroidales bacterium]